MEENNTIWEILEISDTKNIKDIKKAYSRKAKIAHPEENPTEFMRLRRAYEQALRYSSVKSYEENELSDSNREIELSLSKGGQND